MTRTRIAAIAALTLAGCASPLHLTYDHGRAYTEAVVSQADLTRTSVATSNYQLYGVEAEAIRIRVQEKTTDEEDSDSSAVD
ncbi:MAG: hypothetical protein KTR31_12190 [Myxococcales bacterium]|nr:hypothetical protein [Myxococcales bacterium]